MWGGGSLSETVARRARELGWPLWTTYGMTETSSQIATSLEGDLEWLPVLPDWELDTGENRSLKIRGSALFSGYLRRTEAASFKFDSVTDGEGWFCTGDKVSLRNNQLKFIGRSDDLVKILGELISISKLEREFAEIGLKNAILPVPHKRRGHRLIAFIEGDRGQQKTARDFNSQKLELEKISDFVMLKTLPVTGPGKVDRSALRGMLAHRKEET